MTDRETIEQALLTVKIPHDCGTDASDNYITVKYRTMYFNQLGEFIKEDS